MRSYGEWQPVRVWFPRQINGKWYLPGQTVFRRLVPIFDDINGYYVYGDSFSILKE